MPKEKGGERRKSKTVVTRMAQVSLPPISTIRKKRKEGRDKSHVSFSLSYAMDLTGKGNKKGHPLSHRKAK